MKPILRLFVATSLTSGCGYPQDGFYRSKDQSFRSMTPKANDIPPPSIDAKRFLGGTHPSNLIPIDTSELRNFPEEDIDSGETEGVYTSQDGTLFIKDTSMASNCNAEILKIAAEIFQQQLPQPNSGLIAPEQLLVIDQSTHQVLVATNAIDGFRSFRFDNYKIFKSIYPDHEDIASMILTSFALVPNLHNRDLGICKHHQLCVTDLDGLDYSVMSLEAASLALSEFAKNTSIRILNKDSIALTRKVLKELKDKLSENVFRPVSKIDRKTLLEYKDELINCIKNGPTNRRIEGKLLINPEKSFDSLLEKLDTKTVPELLLEALKTRIDVTLDALEKTKAYLETNPQSDQKTLLLKFFQTIKMNRLAYSTEQQDIPTKTQIELQTKYEAALKKNPRFPLESTVPGEFDTFVDRADTLHALHTAIRFIGANLYLTSLEKTEL